MLPWNESHSSNVLTSRTISPFTKRSCPTTRVLLIAERLSSTSAVRSRNSLSSQELNQVFTSLVSLLVERRTYTRVSSDGHYREDGDSSGSHFLVQTLLLLLVITLLSDGPICRAFWPLPCRRLYAHHRSMALTHSPRERCDCIALETPLHAYRK
jgi:hypothetical protein